MRLNDKVAIITGATKGIGLACAQEFAQEGARVVLAGRTESLGETAAEKIRETGGEAVFVRCDVSHKDQIDALVEATVEHYGRIDVVVNNAGVNHSAKFFDITEEEWDWVMAVDLKGTFLLTQAASRVMVDQGIAGTIV
ncbi:MAG: SDR family NAD(P)-dependent oxidoreductase, partial [Anaerolineae bacterium]